MVWRQWKFTVIKLWYTHVIVLSLVHTTGGVCFDDWHVLCGHKSGCQSQQLLIYQDGIPAGSVGCSAGTCSGSEQPQFVLLLHLHLHDSCNILSWTEQYKQFVLAHYGCQDNHWNTCTCIKSNHTSRDQIMCLKAPSSTSEKVFFEHF